MSTKADLTSQSSEATCVPLSLDLTGLPLAVAQELHRLVGALRENLPKTSDTPALTKETPEQWAQRLQAWVDSHPPRSIDIDDSRESLYAGRGE